MGKKRRELVKKFGYDCKNAAHLLRLLRMALEMLDTGNLNVFRTEDREQLLSIKMGKYSLETVSAEADRLFTEIDEAHRKTDLPEHPNTEVAEMLLQRIIRTYL